MIEEDAQATIDKIADVLRDCQSTEIEIGGHTDSQGREVMNEQLSQARADAVLDFEPIEDLADHEFERRHAAEQHASP